MAIFKIIQENRKVFGGEKFSRAIREEYDYSEQELAERIPKMVHKFRVKDDDGVTYFWGVSSNPESFAPLDMVGADLGCTTIEYKDPETGRYTQL